MTFRGKLLLAQAPLLAALVVCGAVGSAAVVKLGRSSERILEDNYRSVLAAQRMADALERIDRGALFVGAGRRDEGLRQVGVHRANFEAALREQEGNLTEPGEAAVTTRLRTAWRAYEGALDAFERLPDEGDARVRYFDALRPASDALRRDVERVLTTNQDAMVRKSELSARESHHQRRVLVWVALAGCLLGLAAAAWLTARLLRPVATLAQAARRIGAGDLEARARVEGADEIATLAREFDAMAESLQRYRRSSLGELLEAQQAAQAAIDALPDPVLVLGAAGRLTHVNQAAEVLLGGGIDAGSVEPLATLEPALREVVVRATQHVLAGKGAFLPRGLDEAVTTRGRDGERWLLPRATPVHAEEGAIVGVAVVLHDVTRLRRFGEAQSDRVAAVAHELRTPLTSLRMAIHLCVEQLVGPLTEKQAELLHAAREDTERLRGTVDELLELSRMEAGRLELRRAPVDATTLVHAAVEAARGAAAQRGQELGVEVLPGVGAVEADAERLQLVLGNFLANAIRHAPEGSRIAVRARNANGARVRFEVADHGPGVPPELREAVFQKFFQVPGQPAGGAGLGLFLAREVVEAHGGRIGVEGAPGEGATFWFEV